jgi:hypothetical protein
MTAKEFYIDFNKRLRAQGEHYTDWKIEVDGHLVFGTRLIGDSVVGEIDRHPMYNRTQYVVCLLFGEWPDNKTLGEAFGAVAYCGGAQVTLRDDGAKFISVCGCD